MAKRTIRFPLKLKNGAEVRTIEELREHFDLNAVIGYYSSGKLLTWFKDRYYDDIVVSLENLNPNDADFSSKLCEILGVEADTSSASDYDNIKKSTERIAYLKSIIDDNEVLSHAENLAINQADLEERLSEGCHEIYLYKGSFEIPLDYENVTYYGYENPFVTVKATDNADFKSKNIQFTDIIFGWDISGLTCHDEISVAEMYWSKSCPDTLEEYTEMENPRALLLLERLYYTEIENTDLKKKYSEIGRKIGNVQSFIIGNPDISESYLPLLKYLADKGKPFDQTLYAYTLIELGNKKNEFDMETIKTYLSRAAEQGDAWAMTLLGDCYGEYGSEKNYEEAAKWYKKAADMEFRPARQKLVNIYNDDKQVKEKKTDSNDSYSNFFKVLIDAITGFYEEESNYYVEKAKRDAKEAAELQAITNEEDYDKYDYLYIV